MMACQWSGRKTQAVSANPCFRRILARDSASSL
jgi:hypothetical protein